MVKFKTIYNIRVVYKSGYFHDFEVYSFTYNQGEGTYRWEAVSDKNKPIHLGADEVAAVYQIGYRKTIF